MEVWERNQLFRTDLVETALEHLLPIRSSRVRYVCCTVLHDGSEYGGAQGKGGATVAHIGTNPANLPAPSTMPRACMHYLPPRGCLLHPVNQS